MVLRQLSFFLIVVGASPAAAQVATTLNSGGSEIRVTVWATGSQPTATVLLLPGWGGGPTDVLGIGKALSSSGVSVVVLTPRGWHQSEGVASFSNSLGDIAAVLKWIRSSSRSDLNTSTIVLGGHSWGGGVALAYAARDTSVHRVFSVAGTDHGQFIRQYGSESAFAAVVDRALASSAAPEGPIRFKVADLLRELAEGQATYGLIENAERLAARRIMLLGGWEDVNVTVDLTLLPLYRALRKAGGQDVTFKTYHANHGFGPVRSDLHADVLEWIRG